MKIDDLLMEAAPKRKKVIRKGKTVIRKKCPPGFRLVGNRCVRQKSSERIARRRGARKGSRKGKAARKRNLKRSLKIRSRRGLK